MGSRLYVDVFLDLINAFAIQNEGYIKIDQNTDPDNVTGCSFDALPGMSELLDIFSFVSTTTSIL